MQKKMTMMMMMVVFAAFADQDVILKSLNISSNHLPKRAPNLHKMMVSVRLLSPLLLLRDCRGHHCVASDEPQATDSDQGLSPSCVCSYGDILEIQTVRMVSTFCNSVEITPQLLK
jgi:hypothetical protein